MVCLLVWMCSAYAWAGEVLYLQGLDKVTGRVSNIEISIGTVFFFGTLEITPRACEKRPPEEPPEVTAFLEIVDNPPGGKKSLIFSSWMFASSPGIFSLDHPVYDVWVVDCK